MEPIVGATITAAIVGYLAKEAVDGVSEVKSQSKRIAKGFVRDVERMGERIRDAGRVTACAITGNHNPTRVGTVGDDGIAHMLCRDCDATWDQNIED